MNNSQGYVEFQHIHVLMFFTVLILFFTVLMFFYFFTTVLFHDYFGSELKKNQKLKDLFFDPNFMLGSVYLQTKEAP